MINNHIISISMDIVKLEKIKRNLRQAIQKSGMTQAELAAKISVSQSCIAHYIRGDILPGLDTFAELCRVLDEDPKDLLGLREE